MNICMALLWLAFAFWHVQTFRVTGNIALLFFCASETLLAYFFIFRSASRRVSHDVGAWSVAIAGTAAPLILSPTGNLILSGGTALIMLAALVQVAGLFSLNRSFAVVPAQRVIKTSGLYRYVRHPMYASYSFSFTGYLLVSMSLYNVLVISTAIVLLFFRINFEEEHLLDDEMYRSYCSRVRWRLIPFVY